MILRSICLENIGLFRDPFTIDLEPGPMGACSAIVGLNGTGKSTIFEAVGLGLFGASDKLTFPSRLDYEARVRSLLRPLDGVRRSAVCGRVSLCLDVFRRGETQALEVTRRWCMTDKLEEELEVSVGGAPIPLRGRELDLWLANWAPPQRAGVVLFDAEAVYSASEEQVRRLLECAFKQAFGL